MRGKKNGVPRDRGASELVGIVLLFGMAIAGTGLLLVTGTALQEDVTDDQRLEAAEMGMTELDEGIQSIAEVTDGAPKREFQVTDREGETVSVLREDRMRITVDGNRNCQTEVRLDAIRHDLGSAGSVTYQAGGVFKTTESGTVVASPPEVAYRDGSLELSLVVLEGSADRDFTARKDVQASQQLTEQKRRDLFGAQECRRPGLVTIEVRSERFHGAWARYFQREMPDGTVTHDAADHRVTVTLTRSHLPEQSDDDRNRVVDFSEDVRVEEGEIVIAKGTGKDYHASVRFLGSRGGNPTTVTETVTRTSTRTVPGTPGETVTDPSERLVKDPEASGKPVAVTFVLDESGSMGTRTGDSTRLATVQAATERFLGKLQAGTTGHRAALVGYTARYDDEHARTHHVLSADLSGVRSTVDSLSADGDTPIGAGIQEAGSLYGDGSSHRKVVILLTDGQHNTGTDPEDAAENLDGDVTVHTVGVGDDVDEDTLEDVAAETGGEYHHVDDSEELDDVFDRLLADVTPEYRFKDVTVEDVGDGKTKVTETWPDTTVHHLMVRRPMTIEMDVGGEPRTPWARGNSPVEKAVNYHAAAANPEGLTVEDGRPVTFSAAVYECDEDAREQTGEKVTRGSQTYNETVCTATTGKLGRADEIHVFTDGETVSDLEGGYDVTAVVPDRYVSGGTFDLDSNQAVLVFEYTGTGGGTDYSSAIVLFEAGKAESEFTTDWLLDFQVDVVESRDT